MKPGAGGCQQWAAIAAVTVEWQMAKPSILAALLGVLFTPVVAAGPTAPVLNLRADATAEERVFDWERDRCEQDRKSTRLNSSHYS